ncbi:Crinkler (CRN) [Phytophthora megakarya]|uniref:Crinkler (CRN) n=1 Tax=Phytophthora megakarya TaxID=4795 RepID=A0A225VA17_9STRA|nr:Crinkler (CRN) [Phytophthora megakarya]
MVKLFCAIVGVDGSAFPVEIDENETVGDLKEAIQKKKPNDLKDVDPDKLQLFLAKTTDGAWLDEAGVAAVALDECGHPHDFGDPMVAANWIKNATYFGENFQPGEGDVHVLVVVPKSKTGLWLVTGSVENAVDTKGIRCRLYRLAGAYLGYYDPACRDEDKDNAFWYEDKTLCIHSLFGTGDNALLFDNALHDESITQLRRIYGGDYVPNDTESQASMLSLSTTTSIVDTMTDEFKYQRLEDEKWFGPVGKAQSCHVMSREHCLEYPSYQKYDNDPSNRLALSAEMREWFDARSFVVPMMKISVESTSEGFVLGNRYKVYLVVRAWNADFAKLILLRLKEGCDVSEDGLEMRTSVYVQNKEVFCECMKWKCNGIENRWREHENMVPAVD